MKHSIQHADEQLLVYPAGRHLCIFDVHTREVRELHRRHAVSPSLYSWGHPLGVVVVRDRARGARGWIVQMKFMLQIDEVERITEVTVSQNKKYLAAIELLRDEKYQVRHGERQGFKRGVEGARRCAGCMDRRCAMLG